jgi:hypothetical protein
MAVDGKSKNSNIDWDSLKHPWRLMYQSWHTLGNLLDDWEIPYEPRRSRSTFFTAYEVRRFHLFPYWRPMTVARYEDYTIDYRGPHLPIFASNKSYLDDETIVHEGYDHAIKRNHRYRRVPWYFILPDFLLGRPWPSERSWTWHPAVKVTASILKQILDLELEYGGWRTTKRGRAMIPRITGSSGQSGELQPGQGWATFRYEAQQRMKAEQQGLFDEDQGQD